MPRVIDLEGLPEPVAQAIAETVLSLKSQCQTEAARAANPLKDLPSRSGKVIGTLRRVDIYEER